MKIPTKDTAGRVNGWLMPVWNELEHPDVRPSQVYVTAIAPRSRKGPHLHMNRCGRFHVITGTVVFVVKFSPEKTSNPLREAEQTLKLTRGAGESTYVPPGSPCALYNFSDTEALVINMPNPAWSAEDPDDHPVTVWQDPEGWPPTHAQAVMCGKCGHSSDDHDSGGCCRMSFCQCVRYEAAK